MSNIVKRNPAVLGKVSKRGYPFSKELKRQEKLTFWQKLWVYDPITLAVGSFAFFAPNLVVFLVEDSWYRWLAFGAFVITGLLGLLCGGVAIDMASKKEFRGRKEEALRNARRKRALHSRDRKSRLKFIRNKHYSVEVLPEGRKISFRIIEHSPRKFFGFSTDVLETQNKELINELVGDDGLKTEVGGHRYDSTKWRAEVVLDSKAFTNSDEFQSKAIELRDRYEAFAEKLEEMSYEHDIHLLDVRRFGLMLNR